MSKPVNKEILQLISQKMKANKGKCIFHYLIFFGMAVLLHLIARSEIPNSLAFCLFIFSLVSEFLPLFFFQDIISRPEASSLANYKKLPVKIILKKSLKFFFIIYIFSFFIPTGVLGSVDDQDFSASTGVVTLLFFVLVGVLALISITLLPPFILVEASSISLSELDPEVSCIEIRQYALTMKWDIIVFGGAGFILFSWLFGSSFVAGTCVAVIPVVAGSYAYAKGFRPKAEQKVESTVGSSNIVMA